MNFIIRHTSWFKRRQPTIQLKPVSATIPDYKQERDHFCTMHVTYEDGSKKTYNSRVLQNPVTKKWCVDGMHVIVDVVD